MRKANFVWLIQAGIVIILYYILRQYIDNLWLLLGLFVGTGVIIIGFRAVLIRNHADVLEVLVNPEKHFSHIERFRDKDETRFNVLEAYGNTYIGKYTEASNAINKVDENDVIKDNHLHYNFIVTKLHVLYNNKEKAEYKELLEHSKLLQVCEKVDLPEKTFHPHLLMLEGKDAEAETLLVELIPRVRKRILIPELEYLLALSYYNQGKEEDCLAVIDFMIEKDYPIIYTKYMQELKVKLNK